MKHLEKPPALTGVSHRLNANTVIARIMAGNEAGDRALIQRINDEYLYWDKVKYQLPVEQRSEEELTALWWKVKISRAANRREIILGTHSFSYTTTDKIFTKLHLFDLHLGGTLGGQGQIPDAEKHRYLLGSIMEESIASSQIEGAVTSRVLAKEMLRKNRPPRNQSERMIFNNFQTIQHILATKHEPLTPAALLKLHRLMTTDTLDKPEEAGQFRQHDDIHVVNAVSGDIIHTPPAAPLIPPFINDLCHFFNDDTPDFFMHPVVKASIIHFLIGYFHPFTDGNGRTSRALFYWYLLRKGYWLTEYLSISRLIMQSRTQYYRAFQYTEVDDNDLTYFIAYQVDTLSKAYDALKQYIDRKTQEKRQLLVLQRDAGLSPRQAQIVSWLRNDPHITLSAKEVELRLGVANQTARFDIQALIQQGYLAELPINRKEKHYVPGKRFTEPG
jgi:Fic family protein